MMTSLLLAALLQTAQPAQSGSPARCVETTATLDVQLSTTTNVAGDAFTFTLVDGVEAAGGYPAIPSGTKGYGLLAYVTHAGAGGKAGMLVLEPRYVVISGGRRIPVMADPVSDERVVSGKSKNAPGGADFIPGIGLMVDGYNALHRGKEVVLPKGTPLLLLVGDDLATSGCFVTPHIQ
jgi:hypothetical protein